MSGLLVRPHMTAGQDGFRDASSKQGCDVEHHWVPRSVSRLGSIDHTICSVSSKLRPQREQRWLAITPNSLCRAVTAASGTRCARDCKRSPLTISFQAMRAVLLASATAASLGGLRLSSSISQGEACPLARAGLLDHGGGADHQSAAQGLVAGAGDHAEPRLAGGGVILRASGRSRRQSRRPERKAADRAPSSTSREAPIGPTPGISARRRLSSSFCVPGHQLGLDLRKLRLELRRTPRHVRRTAPCASSGSAAVAAMRASSGSILSSPLAAISPNSAA